MYTVIVEASFSAVHRVRMPDGALELLHGHDWIVRAHFSRDDLDTNGMVVDFEHARASLRAVTTALHHTDLADHPANLGENPTAEAVAKYVYDCLHATLPDVLARVDVTEAPGCLAMYEPRSRG